MLIYDDLKIGDNWNGNPIQQIRYISYYNRLLRCVERFKLIYTADCIYRENVNLEHGAVQYNIKEDFLYPYRNTKWSIVEGKDCYSGYKLATCIIVSGSGMQTISRLISNQLTQFIVKEANLEPVDIVQSEELHLYLEGLI